MSPQVYSGDGPTSRAFDANWVSSLLATTTLVIQYASIASYSTIGGSFIIIGYQQNRCSLSHQNGAIPTTRPLTAQRLTGNTSRMCLKAKFGCGKAKIVAIKELAERGVEAFGLVDQFWDTSYFVSINIETPPQHFSVTPDTGSS